MPRPLQLPEPFDEGAFTVRAGLVEKVPMSSMRTLPNPFRGVRSHAEPESVDERFAMLSLVCPDGLVLSHCSAARVHGLPVPKECQHPDLHVMAAGGRRVRRRGVVAHRGLERREVVTVRGLPVTGLADTWSDLAPFVDLDGLVVLGDAVAQRLGSLDPLASLAGSRRQGMDRAREALKWIRVGARSPMETRSRVLFGRAGLPEPELNGQIHDPQGGWLATSDLVWREQQVAGEYQGEHHFADYRQGDKDLERRRSVEAIGWTYVDDYYRRPRRLALVHRLAGELGCDLDPEGMAAIDRAPGLPGDRRRPCGG